MELKRLQLNNHRNYAHLDLVPGPAVNVFVGANGQGKTNLLEAVAMLALSSSPRARRDLELLGPVTPAARIHAEVESAGRGLEGTITPHREGGRGKRVIRIDRVRPPCVHLP